MKTRNILKKMFSFILVLIFGVVCIITTTVLIFKSMKTYENISNYVENINIFDYQSSEKIVNNANNTLRTMLEKDFLKFDVPKLVIDEVIDSDESTKIITDYIYEYSNYILLNNERPNFPNEKIIKKIEQEYIEQTGKNLSENQKKDIKKYVEIHGKKIEDSIGDRGETGEIVNINYVQKIILLINSEYTLYALIATIIIVFLIIFILELNLKTAINKCSKIIILDGILIILGSLWGVRMLIMYFNNKGLIDNLAISLVENGFTKSVGYGVALIVIGLIFMIISGISLKKEKKNKSNKILEQVIENEIVNSSQQDEKNIEVDQYEAEENQSKPNSIKMIEMTENENKNSTKTESATEEVNEKQSEETKEEANERQDEQVEKDDEKTEKIQEKSLSEQQFEQMKIENDTQQETNDEEENQESDMQTIELEEIEETNHKEEDEINNDSHVEINDSDYTEIDDNIEEIEKKDIEIKPLENIEINVVFPEKGKEIKVNLEQEEEEEIELL